jgi:hypothetical protein
MKGLQGVEFSHISSWHHAVPESRLQVPPRPSPFARARQFTFGNRTPTSQHPACTARIQTNMAGVFLLMEGGSQLNDPSRRLGYLATPILVLGTHTHTIYMHAQLRKVIITSHTALDHRHRKYLILPHTIRTHTHIPYTHNILTQHPHIQGKSPAQTHHKRAPCHLTFYIIISWELLLQFMQGMTPYQ